MIGNYIKAAKAALTTAKLMKTGQTTSYRTGDDGDIEAGRNTSFTVLAENNPFGNTNRFTDELGGQTYTNNIVIDWSTYDGSTVLGWLRTSQAIAIWNTAIDTALTVSIGTFTTGWRLPNVIEIMTIANYSVQRPLNYAPFNLNNTSSYWTGTTQLNNTLAAISLGNTNATLSATTKTTSVNWLACRTFTVTGTTLS